LERLGDATVSVYLPEAASDEDGEEYSSAWQVLVDSYPALVDLTDLKLREYLDAHSSLVVPLGDRPANDYLVLEAVSFESVDRIVLHWGLVPETGAETEYELVASL